MATTKAIRKACIATLLLGVALTVTPTTEAICLLHEPDSWRDYDGGLCTQSRLHTEPRYVCITSYPVENCGPL